MENSKYFKEFVRYASLNVLGMLGISCYILADTFFISQGLGSNGLTALNLAIPVYSFVHYCQIDRICKNFMCTLQLLLTFEDRILNCSPHPKHQSAAMGILGAVLATGLAPLISMAILTYHWIRKRNGFRFVKMGIYLKNVRSILTLGFPSLISEVSSGIVMIVFNIIPERISIVNSAYRNTFLIFTLSFSP